MIIVNKNNEYLVVGKKIHHNETKKYNLFKYIYDFILNFTKKYNLNFDINLIIQDDKASINNLKNICDNLLEDLYDITFLYPYNNYSDKEDSREEENVLLNIEKRRKKIK